MSEDADILRLWRKGKDTLDIARILHVEESYVYNRLRWILHPRIPHEVRA